jgi:hypothetical protein
MESRLARLKHTAGPGRRTEVAAERDDRGLRAPRSERTLRPIAGRVVHHHDSVTLLEGAEFLECAQECLAPISGGDDDGQLTPPFRTHAG